MKKTQAQKVKEYTETLKGRLGLLTRGAKRSAKVKGFTFDISVEDVLACWLAQEGRCKYTGWEMSTITGDNRLVSIERIDNTKGYLKDNFILVCWCTNRARNTLDLEFFVEMCNAVVQHHKSAHIGDNA
jgi:hypothetical protein